MNKKTAILSLISIAILFGLMVYGSMQMKKPPTVTEPYPTTQETVVIEDEPTSPQAPQQPAPAQNPSPVIKGKGGVTICTMDAMMCPDGNYVGRSGPNCEFVCPGN